MAAPAVEYPAAVCTTLAPLSDADCLGAAERRRRTERAPGSARVTAQEYGAPRDAHRRDWHERVRSGRDTARPVERVGLDQEEGRKRPIGTPTVADTSVQRAVALRWGAIDEPELQDCSDGLRAGRRPHHARTELGEQGVGQHSNGIIDADRRGCCDSLDHGL
jgi:retron-type reverse transcriptase